MSFSTDPCSTLNKTEYPTLWISGTSGIANVSAYANIASQGNPIKFVDVVRTLSSTAPGILASGTDTSSVKLLNYLSTKNIKDVLLNNGNESIVDTYIVGPAGLSKGPAYTYSQPGSPLLQNADFTSLVSKLVSKNYLLSSDKIYSASSANKMNLIYLYSQAKPDTSAINSLENVNLNFYGAFLAEYCFYSSRYEFLLRQYFTIYGTATTAYVAPRTPDPVFALFSSTGTGINQYGPTNPTTLSQSDYLKGLAYHLACLNTRMTDMRLLLSAINTYYNPTLLEVQEILNGTGAGSHGNLQSVLGGLKISANEANNYLNVTDFKKGVMEYNSQKNQYSSILLGLYAFLNISAIAMVVHLSRQ